MWISQLLFSIYHSTTYDVEFYLYFLNFTCTWSFQELVGSVYPLFSLDPQTGPHYNIIAGK